MRWVLPVVAALVLTGCAPVPMSSAARDTTRRVLVFTRTEGFRHPSIDAAVAAIQELGSAHGFEVTRTEDPSAFDPGSLGGFDVIAFVLTTGDVLDPPQEQAMREHLEGGAGFVGIHSATDTEYGWPWYRRLIGARFAQHPATQHAVVRVQDRRHPSTRSLPTRWELVDEWYDFDRDPRASVHVLAVVSERSYEGGTMGSDHPIAWCHSVGRGRSWYTGLGHPEERFSDPEVRSHLLGGILWAASGPANRCSVGSDREVLSLRLAGPGSVGGEVYASRACRGSRDVDLLRVRGGEDREVRDDRTNRRGAWATRAPSPGDYRAVVARSDGCRALRSGIVTLAV